MDKLKTDYEVAQFLALSFWCNDVFAAKQPLALHIYAVLYIQTYNSISPTNIYM
jgi:hypothetical protein